MDSQWDLVISSLQDIYNANEVTTFDDDTINKRMNWESLSIEQLQDYLQRFQEHRENIDRSQRLLDTVRSNLQIILDSGETKPQEPGNDQKEMVPGGKQYWISSFNPVGTIPVGSEVAFKPKKAGLDEEWIQCIVIKVSADGIRYEVQDPEPDEMGNAGKVFKCTWKEILVIPGADNHVGMKPYPMGTKVLARYPETTTFYPAIVSRENKRDNKVCKLRFDGEEEVNKETEVARSLVLPFPTVSATPVNNAKR